MFGFLNLDKPAGITSRDAVNHVQKLVRPVRIGHAGTLDPLATGVLVICLGQATRLVPRLHELPKTYVAEFLLGVSSVSDDTETELEPLADAPVLTAAAIEAVLPRFRGRISQIPPAHSAVKIQGRRAYELARTGADVDITPREVDIHRFELVRLTPERMVLEIECSSGTYIRSLGRDLGRAVGSAAVMTGLTRTRIGPFNVEQAVVPAWLTRDNLQEAIISPAHILPDQPMIVATPNEQLLVHKGRSLYRPVDAVALGEVSIVDEQGNLLALGECLPQGQIQPRMVFVSPPQQPPRKHRASRRTGGWLLSGSDTNKKPSL